MILKEKAYLFCKQVINEKIRLLQHTLGELRNSAANETKSTAGDKHETALAMLQIEQKNTGVQLENLVSQKVILDKLDPFASPIHVTSGALIKTNKGYFFLSIALGKILIDGIIVIVLSPQSPLGSGLLHSKVNDTTTVNGIIYQILEII